MFRIDFVSAALGLTKFGFSVFPLAQGSKVPAVKGGHGVKDATRDEETIRGWGKTFPHANVGIACGAESGIMVIDVDPRNGGFQSMQVLATKGRIFPPCPISKTGNGGKHMLYRHDPKVTNSKGKLGSGIDVKASGGYIVAPPSWIDRSESGPGGAYEWVVDPQSLPVPRAPIWLTTMLASRPLPDMRLNGQISSVGGLAAFVGRQGQGNRNAAAYWAARRALETLPRMEAMAEIRSIERAAVARGLNIKEIHATMQSAVKAHGGK